jgi:hypothetical protein
VTSFFFQVALQTDNQREKQKNDKIKLNKQATESKKMEKH